MNSGLFFLGRHWASSYMPCILHFRAGTGAPPLRFYPRIFHPRHLLNPRSAFGVAGTDPYSLSTLHLYLWEQSLLPRLPFIRVLMGLLLSPLPFIRDPPLGWQAGE